ncbi:DUF724 domain-containing protein 3-like isoform X1 [Asparagus officinalis]|uniref:DUF724 domain-containing protein 3-like isoform X1 n=1 Tax=Asparagus officinalis TaxID=4686 RepID=UPI00098DFA35|nr:DUF724 domain-containing protein 3-like isoform X1 [Asparagus officinalis]
MIDGRGDLSRLYSVCFPMSREEFQFRAGEIRRRMEWVKGQWIPFEDGDDQEGVPAIFAQGTQVEISGDRENFGAAWFVGTILKVLGKTNFLVQYENLYSNNLTELKEIVDIQYIRPCPPISDCTSFNVLDEVEGFDKNGWFAGVVCKILPGQRYTVKYKHQDNEMVFDHILLRPCCVWEKYRWVHTSQSFQGNPAVRGKKFSASKSFIHPSSDLMSGDDGSDAVTKSSFLGSQQKRAYRPSQGVIELSQASKISEENSVSKHLDLVDEISQGASLEDGVEFFQPGKKFKEDCKKSKYLLGEHEKLVNDAISVTRKQRSRAAKQSSLPTPLLTSSSNGENSDISGVVNLKDKNVRDSSFKAKSFKPSKTPNKQKLPAENLLSVDGKLMDSSKETPPTVVKCSTASRLPNDKVGSNAHSNPLSKEFCHGQDKSGVDGTDESSITRKESCSFLGERTVRQAVEANFYCSVVGLAAVSLVPPAKRDNGRQIPSTSRDAKMRRKKLAIRKRQPEISDVDVIQRRKEMKKHNGSIPPKHKDDFMTQNSPGNDAFSLPKMQAGIMKTPPATPLAESYILNVSSLENSVVQQSQSLSRNAENRNYSSKLAQAGVDERHQDHPSVPNGSVSNNVAEMEIASIDPPHTEPSPMEEDNTYHENEFSPSRFLSENENVIDEIDDRVPRDPSPSGSSLSREDGVSDHNVLTPCGSISARSVIEMGHAPSSLISSTVNNGIGEVGHCVNELGENGSRLEINVKAIFKEHIAPEHDELASVGLSSAEDITKDGEIASERSPLPFTKRSQLWEVVESREIFNTFPQHPHFQSLLQYEKDLREGMAIGLMESFACLVTDIRSLIIDSTDDFEEKLRALVTLESNGFNIQPVRARLLKLKEISGMRSQSEGKKHSLEAKLLELHEEKEKNDLLMFLIDQEVSEWQQKLACLVEKRASMVLEHEKKYSEIVALKKDIQAAEEASRSATLQLSAALAAPW